jgi:hypothetical protein
VTIAKAEAESETIAEKIRQENTISRTAGQYFRLEPMKQHLVNEVRPAILALTGLLLAAAFVGAGRLGHFYRVGCAAALVAFLAVSAVAVQARLYQVGHDRDPNAPIRAVRNFTPPLVGPVKVGNFTVWSFPHVGGVLLVAAAALSIAGSRKAMA